MLHSGGTIAVAESCTGGLLGAALTDVSGSSAFFRGGIIAYSNDIKKGLLKIKPELLKQYGAVSRQTALAMAVNVRRIMHSDIGIATTGIAGPGGGTKMKPVGLVYIAVAEDNKAVVRKCLFLGTRGLVRKQTVDMALSMMEKHI